MAARLSYAHSMDIAPTSLPPADPHSLPDYHRRAVDRTLCQGMVPRELLRATREEWRARGVDTGIFLTWALTQYLTAVNPERAETVLKEIKY